MQRVPACSVRNTDLLPCLCHSPISVIALSVAISVQMDRVVFFLSDRVLHRVLPARAERFCFTIWMDGTHTNLPEHNMLDISQVSRLHTPTRSHCQRNCARHACIARCVSHLPSTPHVPYLTSLHSPPVPQFQDLESLCGHLALSPAQRLLARGVYESAFARSIKECMRDAKGCREMVAQHQPRGRGWGWVTWPVPLWVLLRVRSPFTPVQLG